MTAHTGNGQMPTDALLQADFSRPVLQANETHRIAPVDLADSVCFADWYADW